MARRQAVLAELMQTAAASEDLPGLLERTVRLLPAALGVSGSAIWEALPEQGAFLLRASSGWDEPAERAASADSILSAALSGGSVLVQHWSDEARFRQHDPLRAHDAASSLALAIGRDRRPFGVLELVHSSPGAFDAEAVQFAQSVADLLALAVASRHPAQRSEQEGAERTRATEAPQRAAASSQAVLEERQRLARELHDSVIQSLYGITLHAQAAQRLLAAGDLGVATESLRMLQDTAQEAMDEMRLLIFELRPPILEQVGLVAALQARLSTVEGRATLQTRLIADEIGQLPAPVEQALYRVAQEALNNALKHARAGKITVELRRRGTLLSLTISDDGIGFDPAAAGLNGGQGLRGIGERVSQLHGRLSLKSAPGSGSQLHVEIGL
jgi:signal transduction histidine kinase